MTPTEIDALARRIEVALRSSTGFVDIFSDAATPAALADRDAIRDGYVLRRGKVDFPAAAREARLEWLRGVLTEALGTPGADR